MNVAENIRDVFSILHDGIIAGFTIDDKLLVLRVECHYLAELIDKSFDSFYVELNEIHVLSLLTWPNPFDSPVKIQKTPTDIFRAKLEILSVDIIDENVVIACNQHDLDFAYCGGYLTLSCNSIRVYDHDKNELTIDHLDSICNIYWNKGNIN